MAGPIARRPAGLLDLLLTQQQGKNPTNLGDDVVPVLDIVPFYNQERLDTDIQSVNMTAVNSFTSAIIPAGESWRVLAWSVRGAFATVNQTVRLGFRMQQLGGGGLVDLPSVPAAAVGATDLWGGATVLPGDSLVIYPAGTRFLTYAQSINLDAQANIALTSTLLFVQMSA